MQSEWGVPWDHIYETWTYPQFGAFAEALVARLKDRAEAARNDGKSASRADDIRTQTRWR